MPTSQQLSRIKVKVFGHSGVGKTTLLESLKCGYLGSFFRRKGGSGPIHRQTSKISITRIPFMLTTRLFSSYQQEHGAADGA